MRTGSSPVSERLLRASSEVMLRLPSRLLSRLAGGTVTNRRGHSLDPQVHMILELNRMLGFPELHTLSVEEARRENARTIRIVSPPAPRMHRVEERRIPSSHGEIPVRVYHPAATSGTRPGLVYIHGGGFCLCDLDSHDGLCRELAQKGDAVIVSVDYRLGPEHRFPAAVEDSVAAFRYVQAHASDFGIDATRLAIGGDSAGGNLSAVVCQTALREGWTPPCFQLLVYPALECVERSASREEFRDGYFLTDPLIDWFLAQYFGPDADRTRVEASPARATDLRGQPPAHIVAAGFDPLR
ncbi:MAG: alpha/beta hydrolase, partial [Myxococcales bacterium]|nr:alpha/beta hydrolase [Myxococcales bacterium]